MLVSLRIFFFFFNRVPVYLCCFSFSLFQQDTTRGVPLLFFFFTFSTGYHTWCTSCCFSFYFFNRIPHVVYLCFFTDLSIFWGQNPHPPTHPHTHAHTHTHTHFHPPTHTHPHTHTLTHTHSPHTGAGTHTRTPSRTLPTHSRRHTHPLKHPHTHAHTHPHTHPPAHMVPGQVTEYFGSPFSNDVIVQRLKKDIRSRSI